MKTRALAPLAALASLAACATPAPPERVPESPAALARAEPDPACKGTVRERLLAHGLEQVTVALDVDAGGGARLARVLSPELTPAQAEDVRRAFESCPWLPAAPGAGLGPDGRRTATVQVRATDAPP